MSEIQTGYLGTIAIGTTQAAEDQGEFESDTYTEVGWVSDIGEFGDEHTPVEFLALNTGRVIKLRGSKNAGDMPVTYAFDGSDTGQDDLKTAFETTSQSADEFNFRVQFNDAGSGSPSSPTTMYFRAKIMSRRIQSITNDNVITVQATLAINSDVIEVAAV